MKFYKTIVITILLFSYCAIARSEEIFVIRDKSLFVIGNNKSIKLDMYEKLKIIKIEKDLIYSITKNNIKGYIDVQNTSYLEYNWKEIKVKDQFVFRVPEKMKLEYEKTVADNMVEYKFYNENIFIDFMEINKNFNDGFQDSFLMKEGVKYKAIECNEIKGYLFNYKSTHNENPSLTFIISDSNEKCFYGVIEVVSVKEELYYFDIANKIILSLRRR